MLRRKRMGDISGKLGRVSLLEVPESRRKQLFREVRQRLRQRVVEDKMWRWLLDVDRLTINGCILWGENRRPKRPAARKSRRK